MLSVLDRSQAGKTDLPWPDVYFSPGYGAAAEASDHGPWRVAVWSRGPILFPYVVRTDDDGVKMASSPYGYAGSWAPTHVPLDEWRSFRQALRELLAGEGIGREFQRLSGLVPGREPLLAADPALRGRHHNDTVGIDLTAGYDACWAAAEGRSRTKTRKARTRGYSWHARPAEVADLMPGAPFRDLYDETMRRVGAAPYYLFGDAYYQRLHGGLDGRLWLLEVRGPEGQTGAAGVAMSWPPLLHLHLVGATRTAQRDGAGNMLYDGLIRWGAEQGGFATLHIGGGQAPDDAMFYFKRGFGGRRFAFWVANGDFQTTGDRSS